MQDKKLTAEYALMSIPAEALAESGIEAGTLLQVTAEKGKIVIENVDEADLHAYVCDGDCESCPINETDCDGECTVCPCYGKCE